MSRAAATADAFTAVAEPHRRRIIGLLSHGERSVNHLAHSLRVRQPQASKHLRVLREVGLVSVRHDGQQRLYRLNPPALKPIHDWVKSYEHLWNERFDRLEAYLQEVQQLEEESKNAPTDQ